MQKPILILISLFFFLHSFAQIKKSNFSIKIGTEYRITPIKGSEDIVIPTLVTMPNFSLDNQISGASINYSLSYVLKSKFEIGFSQSFRYDHIYFEFSDFQPGISFEKSVNGVITDYHFFIGKYFTLFKTELFLKTGISLMNRGTNYSRTIFLTDQGVDRFVTDQLNFNFSAYNVNTGFTFGKYEVGIGAYFINGSSANFVNENNIILPYFKLNYSIK